MIYKFKSKAGGDVLMLGPNGDALLRILGREPAAKGIIEPASMAAAIAAIEQAVAADEAARADAGRSTASATSAAKAPPTSAPPTSAPPASADAVALRQRLWPMVDLLKRAAAAVEPVVWGV